MPEDTSADEEAADDLAEQFASLAPPKKAEPERPARAAPKVILVRVGPGIRALDDLNGRKVAVGELEPRMETVVTETFDSLGVKPILVHVPLAGPELTQASELKGDLTVVDADEAPAASSETVLRVSVDPWIMDQTDRDRARPPRP